MPRFKLSEFVIWRYKYGADYEFHLKIMAENEGNPSYKIPEAISSLPEIDPIFDQPYVDAFYMLDSSRPIGMGGLAAIPLSEITNLYDVLQLGELEDFIKIIQGADMAYLKAYYDDPKNKSK